MLIYLNDRQALDSWLEAWREASVMADKDSTPGSPRPLAEVARRRGTG